jgi:NCS1 family nucleobase:cation symporter-1
LRKTKQDELATRTGSSFNWIVLVAWLVPVAIGLYFIFGQGKFAAYLVIPCWIGSAILYILLNKIANKA